MMTGIIGLAALTAFVLGCGWFVYLWICRKSRP